MCPSATDRNRAQREAVVAVIARVPLIDVDDEEEEDTPEEEVKVRAKVRQHYLYNKLAILQSLEVCE